MSIPEQMPESKYVVFKAEDWNSVIKDDLQWERWNGYNNLRVPDAVVIRVQDVFAASTFFGYSNQVQTTIEILVGSFEEVGPELGQVLEQLQNTADYFHSLGVWASTHDAKMPD